MTVVFAPIYRTHAPVDLASMALPNGRCLQSATHNVVDSCIVAPTMTSLELRVSIGPDLGRLLDVARQEGSPVLLKGSHGIGKSEYLKAYAAERTLAFVPLDLSLLEATDLTGLPYRDVERNRTVYAPPSVLPSDAGPPCILALEELNRCDRSVRQPCLQLLTERRLNDYRLPESCFVVGSINPSGERYDVDELDPALLSRFVTLNVYADRRHWAAWAQTQGLLQDVVSLIERTPDIFRSAPPRSWTKAARLLAIAQQTNLAELQTFQLLTGVLPFWAAHQLMRTTGANIPLPPGLYLIERPGDWLEYIADLTQQRRTDQLQQLRRAIEEDARTEQGQRLLATSQRRAALDVLIQRFPPDLRDGLQNALRRMQP